MGFDNLSEQEQSVYNEAKNTHDNEMAERNMSIAADMAASEKKDNPDIDEDEAKQQIFEYLQNHPDSIYPYLVRGAKLFCRMGSHIRKLNLPECHGVYTNEGVHPLVHAEDAVGDVNVMYFGHCNGTINASSFAEQIDLEMESYDAENDFEPKPTGTVKRAYKCVPQIIENNWSMTHHNTRIVRNGQPFKDENAADSVLAASFLVCVFGGLIEPLTSGQENKDTESKGQYTDESKNVPPNDSAVSNGDGNEGAGESKEVPSKWIPSVMQLNGSSEQEQYLSKRLSNLKIQWDQDKVDDLWTACELIADEYGVDIDPRFLLSIIIQEGTGSFNTSSTNRAADGQHGVEKDFAQDLMKANSLIFGKTLGYIYYGDAFREAVLDNNNLPGISEHADIFQYANWATPIIRLNNNKVDIGVYAGHGDWNINVRKNYELLSFDGAASEYNSYLCDIDKSVVEDIAKDIQLPNVYFEAKQNAQDSKGIPNGNYTVSGRK